MPLTTGKDKGFDLDPLADEEPGPLPITQNGPTHAAYPQNDPLEQVTPANMPCLRGPCRYYVQIVTKAEIQNKLDQPVKQQNRYCTVIPGDAIELTDLTVYECNKWDPEDSVMAEVEDREHRREYYKRFNEKDE